jgi:hypothetical protein
MAKAETGARALVKAIEGESAKAYVPTLPWLLLSPVMRFAPVGLLRKFA